MNVLDEVRDGLKTQHPNLRFSEAVGTIIVHARGASGFDVSISEDLTVAYDGWHERFDTPEEALACFAFGLSDRGRLKIEYRGNVAHRWTVESLVDGRWIADSTTGLLFFPIWRARRIGYRQNAALTGE